MYIYTVFQFMRGNLSVLFCVREALGIIFAEIFLSLIREAIIIEIFSAKYFLFFFIEPSCQKYVEYIKKEHPVPCITDAQSIIHELFLSDSTIPAYKQRTASNKEKPLIFLAFYRHTVRSVRLYHTDAMNGSLIRASFQFAITLFGFLH